MSSQAMVESNDGGEERDEIGGDSQPVATRPAIAPEISGGHLGNTNFGGQYGQYIATQVNKTYNPVGGGKPQKPGEFQVACPITVYEKKPISLSSRVFEGCYHSDVTGDRPAAIKITPAEEKNYREAKIYFKVPYHKNIVERFAADTFNFRGLSSIFIAMERCDCNLYDHVKSEMREEKQFDAEKYTWISYQILVALDFLHSHNVVHGDFKPSNVLLILNGNIVKVADFGLSRSVTPGNTSTQLTSPQGGTTGWQAPEILENSERISFKSDVFPCGLTLFFVWSHGKHAYGNRTVSLNHYIVEGTNRNLNGMLVSFASEAEILLDKALKQDPADRPTIEDLLKSQVFRGYEPQRNMIDEVDFTGVFERALREVVQPQGDCNREERIHLGVTSVGLLQDAMRSFIERYRPHLNRMTSGSETSPASANSLNVSSQSGTSPPSSTRPKSHVLHATGQQSEETSPKQVVSGPQSGIDRARLQAFHGSEQQSQETNLKQLVSGPQPPISSTRLQGTPLCRRGCDVILMSLSIEHRRYLPDLISQIYAHAAYRGMGEFMRCDRQSDPERLLERLSNISICGQGVTMVIVACLEATGPLSNALDVNNLRKFLLGKGLSKKHIKQKIQNIRNNMAVFTFQPLSWDRIGKDLAKIVINIHMDKDGGNGELQTVTSPNGKIANVFTFPADGFHFLFDFVQNEKVMRLIRKYLQQEEAIQYCNHH